MNENEQKILPPENNQSDLANNSDEAAKQAAFSIVKPIRTYERDIAESVRKTNASVTSINVMEQKKKEEQQKKTSAVIVEKTESFAWGTVALVTSIILIIGSLGALGFLFFAYKTKTPTVATPQYSIISTEEFRKIDVTNVSGNTFTKQITENLKERTTNRTLTEIKIVEEIRSTNNEEQTMIEQQISSEQFMNFIAPRAPSSLARAFGGPWIFGFYNGDFAEPFLLANLSSFDNAFDGMIKWEKDMAADLGKIFIEHELTVGTSTEKISPTINSDFEDLVIKSKNVRALKDSRDNIVLLYSFLNDKYIVITTNDAVFKEVLNRFLTSKLVR